MVVVFPELLLSATSVATSPTYRYQDNPSSLGICEFAGDSRGWRKELTPLQEWRLGGKEEEMVACDLGRQEELAAAPGWRRPGKEENMVVALSKLLLPATSGCCLRRRRS